MLSIYVNSWRSSGTSFVVTPWAVSVRLGAEALHHPLRDTSLETILKSNEKSVRHYPDAGRLDHGLSCLRQIFVVDGEPSEVLQPGEGSFDDPSLGEDLELARTFIRTQNDLDNPSELVCCPVPKGALVTSVCKYLFPAPELVFRFFNDFCPPYCHEGWLRERQRPSGAQVRQPQYVPSNDYFDNLPLFISDAS